MSAGGHVQCSPVENNLRIIPDCVIVEKCIKRIKFSRLFSHHGGFFRYVEVVGICVTVPVRVSHRRLHLGSSLASPVMATHVSSMSTNLSSSLLPPSVDKAFVVGPGQAPIPAKLVSRITSGQFVDLADSLQSADGRAGASNISRWQVGGF